MTKTQDDRIFFLENILKISKTIQQTNDLDKMMSDTLDLVLSILKCNRAFLLYPCNPKAETWSAPMARNTPEFPGLTPKDIIPMASDVKKTFTDVLATKEPIVFDPSTKREIPLGKDFSIKSQTIMGIYPKIGAPWLLGVHQCDHPRVWSKQDIEIFKEIAYQITNALNTLLLVKDLKEKEKKLENQVNMLEKLNSLTLGREIKMIELKKQLKEAQEKLAEKPK